MKILTGGTVGNISRKRYLRNRINIIYKIQVWTIKIVDLIGN